MKKISTIIIGFLAGLALLQAQTYIPIPPLSVHPHPRTLAGSTREDLQNLIAKQEWAKTIYERTLRQIEPYITRHQSDPTWIVSRLQMYWKTKHTQVYIRAGVYDHAEGEAPVPTVRFTGTRDAVTTFIRPKLEDVLPYMDDPRGLYLQNGAKEGQPWEWTEQAKSGRIIESINREIMGLAETAAFLFWYTQEERYARFAHDLFDVYMQGIYYRKEPIDLAKGHHQTLVGYTSFEVIHEDVLNELSSCYDFLYTYLQRKESADKLKLYSDTFKKMADIQLKNGVTFNNWNLIEARFVAQIATILEADEAYADKKGCHYYLDQIMNRESPRQWSLQKLIKYGFDANTGIWNECPGYSLVVINEFMWFIHLFDEQFNLDLVQQIPVFNKAVLAQAQYLYPNGFIVAFGDTYYRKLTGEAMEQMIRNAQKNGKVEQEELYTRMLKTLVESNPEDPILLARRNYKALFAEPPVTLKTSTKAGTLADFVTPTFSAPNSSYFVQRNGLDPEHGLMISQAGSKGNHAHSNGIAMELYGKGVVLAPEMGIGTSYFQRDYAEYYSQFPAHNTVVVDGISAYPEMRSNHAFEVQHAYPQPGVKQGFYPHLTYSDLYFLEPETNADQNRVMGIIRTSPTTGYYLDIFRSRRKNGQDKQHDYFYHNLGQSLELSDAIGKPLDLKPSAKLAFDDGDSMAYDYLWDKKSTQTAEDFKAKFTLNLPDRAPVYMHLWMKGSKNREVFAVKAPSTKAFRRVMIPDSVANLPMQTLVVRQEGEAWSKPFVAVFEPATAEQADSIENIRAFQPAGAPTDFVGLEVQSKTGRKDFIFSSSKDTVLEFQDMHVEATYVVISKGKEEQISSIFMSNGQKVAAKGYCIAASTPGTDAALTWEPDGLYFFANQSTMLLVPDDFGGGKVVLKGKSAGEYIFLEGKRKRINGQKMLWFELPEIEYGKIEINRR